MREMIKILLARFKHAKNEPLTSRPEYQLPSPTEERIRELSFNPVTPKTEIIALTNQKGGCGKTTTAINLSAYLAHIGYKVLLIDLDPQAHASLGLGVNINSLEKSIYHCLIHSFDIEKTIHPTEIKELDIVPANSLLSGAALEIANLVGREGILKAAIRRMVNKRYDFIFIDCSPSLSLLTLNALVAANFILIPIQVHYYSLEGMRELFSTIDVVRERLNRELEILGILATLFDIRVKMNRRILEQIFNHFKELVFNTVIHDSAKLCEAPFYKRPIHLYDPQSRGAKDYIDLAGEVINRIKKKYQPLPPLVDRVTKEPIGGRKEESRL